MFLFTTLVPVFALITVGYLVVKRDFISKGSVRDFNNLVYYIGLPALLFYRIGKSNVDLSIAVKPVLLCVISMAVGCVIGIIYILLFKKKLGDPGSILQVIVRANTVFIGLPIIFYFFESIEYPDFDKIRNIAMLSLAVLVPINNIVGVLVFVFGKKDSTKGLGKRTVKSLVTNPIIIACIAGVIYSNIFNGFAVPIARTFEAMGGMTLPLSLIAVGCVLAELKISDNYFYVFVISGIKLVIMPLVVFVVGQWLKFPVEYTGVAMILMACPSASTCVTLAQQLGGDVKLTSTVIFGTSVLSVVSLIIVLIMCKTLFV